jgi:hypothetical protein
LLTPAACNAQIQYGRPAVAVEWFCSLIVSLGMLFSLPLVWHVLVEHVRTGQGKRVARVLWVCVALMYLLILTRFALASSVLRGAPLYEWDGRARATRIPMARCGFGRNPAMENQGG